MVARTPLIRARMAIGRQVQAYWVVDREYGHAREAELRGASAEAKRSDPV